MRSAYRIGPRLGAALVIAAVILIGWVARSTRAQEGARSRPRADQPSGDLTIPEVGPATVTSDSLPLPDGTKVAVPAPAPTTLLPDSGLADPAGPGNDDPEKQAGAFLEQNRRIAQGELRKLKDEADQLRTRLGKVEAGIRRWEALVAALDHSEKPAPPGAVLPPGADHPSDLRPLEEPKRAMAVRESVPIAPQDNALPAAKAGSGEPAKLPEPPRTPSIDSAARPKGPDLDIVAPPAPGPALEPR